LFEILFLGTSASAPSAKRGLSAQIVKHNEYRFLIDCGEGTQRQILQSGTGFKNLTRILLTHGTATGRAEGERLLQEGDRQAWLPWDTPKAVRRFLAALLHALWNGHDAGINGFANLSGLLMTYFGARFGVLGVYVSGRTREKQTAITGEDAPSIVGTVIKAVARKR